MQTNGTTPRGHLVGRDPSRSKGTAELLIKIGSHLGLTWKAGTRLPSIRQLADQFAASPAAAHRAIRDLAKDGIVEMRHGSGTWVSTRFSNAQLTAMFGADQCVDSASATLAGLKGKRIGIPFGVSVQNSFAHRAVDYFRSVVNDAGGQTYLFAFDWHKPSFPKKLDADGIMLFNPASHYDLVVENGQPLVVINTALETPVAMADGYDVVSVDQEQGGFLAGKALRDAGCKTACYLGVVHHGEPVSSRTYNTTCRARFEGFQRGWGEAIPESRQLYAAYYGTHPGACAVADILAMQPKPDGIFAATDELAIGITLGHVSHRLWAGKDYQLVGFDGQDVGRHTPHGALTTIDVPLDQMTRRAAELLASRFAMPEQPVRRLFLGSSFYQGQTTTPLSRNTDSKEKSS